MTGWMPHVLLLLLLFLAEYTGVIFTLTSGIREGGREGGGDGTDGLRRRILRSSRLLPEHVNMFIYIYMK